MDWHLFWGIIIGALVCEVIRSNLTWWRKEIRIVKLRRQIQIEKRKLEVIQREINEIKRDPLMQAFILSMEKGRER